MFLRSGVENLDKKMNTAQHKGIRLTQAQGTLETLQKLSRHSGIKKFSHPRNRNKQFLCHINAITLFFNFPNLALKKSHSYHHAKNQVHIINQLHPSELFFVEYCYGWHKCSGFYSRTSVSKCTINIWANRRRIININNSK